MFEVRILEERGLDDARWLGKSCSDATSSEEIDSDGSFMASPTSKSSRSLVSPIAKSSGLLVIENRAWNPAGEPRLHGTSSVGGGAADQSSALPDGHSKSQGPSGNRKSWRSKESCQESSAEDGDAVAHAERSAGSPNGTARDIPFAEWRQVDNKERGERESSINTEKKDEREDGLGTEVGQTASKGIVLKETSREDNVESQISNTLGFTSHTPPHPPHNT